jgi:hypothetical protein
MDCSGVNRPLVLGSPREQAQHEKKLTRILIVGSRHNKNLIQLFLALMQQTNSYNLLIEK